jgi:hypothetical protein
MNTPEQAKNWRDAFLVAARQLRNALYARPTLPSELLFCESVERHLTSCDLHPLPTETKP